MEVTVQEDTGGGYTDITYALSGGISIQGNSDRFSSSQTWIRSFDNTDKIRVRLIRDTGTTNIDTQAGYSRITIERVN